MTFDWRVMWAVGWLVLVSAADAASPDFQREVRPILSQYCYQCHGFDEHSRQGQLRLDRFEGATQPAESGAAAIVPKHADHSELIQRVTSHEADLQMPPPETGKKLTQTQIETLRSWIDAGAEYAPHWAFVKPAASSPPEVAQGDWPKNMIDRFTLHQMEESGFVPSEPASPERLLRRVALDLIGRPPTPDELELFLKATQTDPEQAYLTEVDRLLASPHFGERMALDWLDSARYADTNGYFGDKPRVAWPWRDWVIRAFNDNMPFDQFTIEQLAGDLLPEPTRDQRVATGFHRNSMANNETGIIDEEYRVEAVADRLDTTSTVWLGMTIGCAQCHDHKYDPISQREYYQLFSFFNQSIEPGLVYADSPPPILEVPTPEQSAHLAACQQQRAVAEQAFQASATTLDADLAAWEVTAPHALASLPSDAVLRCSFDTIETPFQSAGTTLQLVRGIQGQGGSLDATQHVETTTPVDFDGPWTISLWIYPTQSLGGVWSAIEPSGRRRGTELIWRKGKLQLNLVHEWSANELSVSTRDSLPSNQWHHVLVSYDGSRSSAGVHIITDGKPQVLEVQHDTLTGSLNSEEPLRIGRRDAGLGFYGLIDEFRMFPRSITPDETSGWSDSERLRGILELPVEKRSASEQALVKDYFIEHMAASELRELDGVLKSARAAESTAKAAIPTTLVMQDLPQPRETHILVRGQYDQLGEMVTPDVPEVIAPHQIEGPRNRLALARWLVSPEHPLTSRVLVNRYWQLFLGEGLVRTPNDFGSQGELPTHPALLDNMAVEFVRSGWNVKALVRLIVTSATYRQSSSASPERLARDPENRILARGPRFRLPAELVRDQALAVSGLLSDRVGGASAKPYQPDGLWEEVSFNEEDTYVVDAGDGPWRRSLYTYIKRQVPPPSMLMFDGTTREKCVVRRSRTNTPLQALVTLNDVTYVEASRALAQQALLDRRQTTDELRIRSLFHRVTSRTMEPNEQSVLLDLLQRERTKLESDPVAVQALLSVGQSPRESSIAAVELAAWTLTAQTILNLDEVLVRR